MEWIQVRVSTTPEGVEPVFGMLLSCGVSGAEIIDNRDMKMFLKDNPFHWDYADEALNAAPEEEAFVVFYITPDEEGRFLLGQVQGGLKALPLACPGLALGALTAETVSVDDEAWLHEWKKHYKPFRIGQSVVVRPVWEEYVAQPGDLCFTIDPGSVFGTGLHQSTRLCVAALEKIVKPGDTLLDIGSGSGILAIISLLLGAKYAFACDIEPAAAIAARENAALNNISPEQFDMRIGDIFTDTALRAEIKDKRYQIIAANIVADVVIRLSAEVKEYLAADGLFVTSGIISERVDEVRSAMEANGFCVVSQSEAEGWHCLVGQPNA